MEIARLRGMLTRRGYELISPHIARDMLSPIETTIIKWIENYYKRNPTLESVTPRELGTYINLRAAARSTPEQLEAILNQVERLEGNPPKDINALTRLSIEQGVIGKAQAVIERYHNGSEEDPLEELEEILDSARHYLSLMLPPPTQLTLTETFELEYVEGGITLSGIPAISDHVQDITKGDSIGFAGRPGIGKTSSLAALLTSSAVNISNYFNDDSRKIHWLQNEGGLNKSRARVFQAGLRMTREEVLAALKEDQNALEALFLERVGKPHDYFHFTSIAGWDTAKVERYIRDHRPSVVVIDMLQHISIRGGEGETEKIKMLWEWVRLMAIQYDCVVISTIQVGESGDNKPYPELADLYYSRTAVQSAVDVMLIMGFVNRPDMADIRFYSSPKNKRKVTGRPENFQAQAVVDLDRCVFDGVYYE